MMEPKAPIRGASPKSLLPEGTSPCPSRLAIRLAINILPVLVPAVDMTTLVPGPGGFVESQKYAEVGTAGFAMGQRRRAELKKMLNARLSRQFGNDIMARSLIELEVDKCLRRGHLTNDDLESLEHSVQQVQPNCQGEKPSCRRLGASTTPGVLMSSPNAEAQPAPAHAPPSPPACQAIQMAQGRHTLPMMRPGPVTARSHHRDLASVSDWNVVASYQANYYLNVAQQKLDREREHRKEQLSSMLAHQRFEMQQKRRSAVQTREQELRHMHELAAQYKRDADAEEKKRQEKMLRYLREQTEQVAERAARRAAERRLKQLEHAETTLRMREEDERQRVEEVRKAKEWRACNMLAMEAGIANVKKKKEAKLAEAAIVAEKNAEWTEMLDKRERDREEALRKRKEKIQSLQRSFEANAGAEMKARSEREARSLQAYLEKAAREAEAEDERRRTKQKEDMHLLMDELHKQVEERERTRRLDKQAGWDVELEHNARAAAEEQAEQEKRMRLRARATVHVRELSQQMQERQAAKANANKMTPLEVSLNRDLLVAVLDNSYQRPPLLS